MKIKSTLLNALEIQNKVVELSVKLARLERAFDKLENELASAMLIIRNKGFKDEE